MIAATILIWTWNTIPFGDSKPIELRLHLIGIIAKFALAVVTYTLLNVDSRFGNLIIAANVFVRHHYLAQFIARIPFLQSFEK